MELAKICINCDYSLMWADITGIETAPGECVIIQAAQGPKMARIKSNRITIEGKKKINNVCKVLRKATEEDMEKYERLRQKEREAYLLCVEKAEKHKLVMKLVRVEFLIDESKAIFYFTADGRVDFRELVKDLAHNFHTRIEMRQIGVRDEAKMVGGVGNCGREFCCSSFLCSFEPVSVRMAKEQNLALSPMKISGACGRLMCCLAYEHDTYMELKRKFPQSGKRVMTEFGEGKILKSDVISDKVTVLMDSGEEKDYKVDEVDLIKERK